MFQILGPPRLVGDDGGGERTVPLDAPRQRVVLSMLLLEAGRVVNVSRLVDAVWGNSPPETARTQIQICISQLRSMLTRTGRDQVIHTQRPGYCLAIDPGDLDANEFVALLHAAQDNVRTDRIDEAATQVAAALALWRGDALEGVDSDDVRARAAHLDEMRCTAIELQMDIGLRQHRHEALVPDLTRLVEEHPMRERMRGQLMTALYRSGRQADALAVYREGRHKMVGELGIEPGPELRALEAAILSGELWKSEGNTHPPPHPVQGPAAGSTVLTGAEEEADPGGSASVPHQLPFNPVDFTGRTDVVDAVEAHLVDGVDHTRVVVIGGAPGVGKSAAALRIAHLLAPRFPGGQLYAQLHGTERRPADPAELLGRFLSALGHDPRYLPQALDERAELYRQTLADRRVCVVLDDAADEAQVAPLIPGSGRGGVLVTSRARLTNLPGAMVVDLEVMEETEGLAMLSRLAGPERVAAEPAAARALLHTLGGLPLAIRIAAAKLIARPHWTLDWMNERLANEGRRLDELSQGDLGVRTSISLSYESLTERARDLLRRVGVFDGAAFPAWAVAPLVSADLGQAEDLAEELVDARLLEVVGMDPTGGPRYQCHALVNLFAREQSTLDPQRIQEAALARLGAAWLDLVHIAHEAAYGGDYTVLHGRTPRGEVPQRVASRIVDNPIDWMDLESVNLVSAVLSCGAAGLDELAWELAVGLVTLWETRWNPVLWERTHRAALEAVRGTDNTRGIAALECSLASLHIGRGEFAAAESALRLAMEGFDSTGDRLGTALAMRNLALCASHRGATGEAETALERAIAGFAEAGDHVGEANSRGLLAHLMLADDRVEDAAAQVERALEQTALVAGRRISAQLGFLHAAILHRTDCQAEATAELVALLDEVDRLDDRIGQLRVRRSLAEILREQGDLNGAGEHLAAALELAEVLGQDTVADEVRRDVAALKVVASG